MATRKTVSLHACPICLGPTLVVMTEDWQTEVNDGHAVPIVGCGNPWHYLVLRQGELETLAGVEYGYSKMGQTQDQPVASDPFYPGGK